MNPNSALCRRCWTTPPGTKHRPVVVSSSPSGHISESHRVQAWRPSLVFCSSHPSLYSVITHVHLSFRVFVNDIQRHGVRDDVPTPPATWVMSAFSVLIWINHPDIFGILMGERKQFTAHDLWPCLFKICQCINDTDPESESTCC